MASRAARPARARSSPSAAPLFRHPRRAPPRPRLRAPRCVAGAPPAAASAAGRGAASGPLAAAAGGVRTPEGFATVEEALAAVAAGGLAVVVDDERRENEGDLIGAAGAVGAEALAFVVRHTSGVVCVGLPAERCEALALPLMVPQEGNDDAMGTAFTVTVDLKEGTSTGISAADRAATLNALADPDATPGWFTRPGHVFPLRARAGGVLERPGHTEAAVDLTRLAGCEPAGVLCELVMDSGEMQRLPQLREFAAEHGLPLISIEQLAEWRTFHGR